MTSDEDMGETTWPMAEIDPAAYDNANKTRLSSRRPELYQKNPLLHIGSWDYMATNEPLWHHSQHWLRMVGTTSKSSSTPAGRIITRHLGRVGNAPDLPCSRPLRGCIPETVLAATLSLARIHPQLSWVVQVTRQCVLSARIDKIEQQIPPQIGKRGICCWLGLSCSKIRHTLERPLSAISAKSNKRAHRFPGRARRF